MLGRREITDRKEDTYLFGSESSGLGKTEVLWRGSEDEKRKVGRNEIEGPSKDQNDQVPRARRAGPLFSSVFAI